jgi:hypothetical protein
MENESMVVEMHNIIKLTVNKDKKAKILVLESDNIIPKANIKPLTIIIQKVLEEITKCIGDSEGRYII